MLDYRFRRLDAARYNAMLNGCEGVQFPWQSINGDEVTPYYSEGQNEIHINFDVAFAFAQYFYSTGDERFLREQAWPVMQGVAQWICSRAEKTSRGWEIRNVVGMDESICNIHNNAYTNMAAVLILREATAFAGLVGSPVPDVWREISEKLFIPVDPETQVILKHDCYRYEGGMCVPETLGAFYPLTCDMPDKQRDATFRYHVDLAHTYLGMPMFSSAYAVWVARMGDRRRALNFLKQGCLISCMNHICNSANHQSLGMVCFRIAPIKRFLTNPAGFLMSCLFGFPGLQLDA